MKKWQEMEKRTKNEKLKMKNYKAII